MNNNVLMYSLKIIFFTMLISCITTPIVKKIAIHVNALDIPETRKVHKKVMPRLGGLAIFFAFVVLVLQVVVN